MGWQKVSGVGFGQGLWWAGIRNGNGNRYWWYRNGWIEIGVRVVWRTRWGMDLGKEVRVGLGSGRLGAWLVFHIVIWGRASFFSQSFYLPSVYHKIVSALQPFKIFFYKTSYKLYQHFKITVWRAERNILILHSLEKKYAKIRN